jgi:hypothetical protein
MRTLSNQRAAVGLQVEVFKVLGLPRSGAQIFRFPDEAAQKLLP